MERDVQGKTEEDEKQEDEGETEDEEGVMMKH